MRIKISQAATSSRSGGSSREARWFTCRPRPMRSAWRPGPSAPTGCSGRSASCWPSASARPTGPAGEASAPSPVPMKPATERRTGDRSREPPPPARSGWSSWYGRTGPAKLVDSNPIPFIDHGPPRRHATNQANFSRLLAIVGALLVANSAYLAAAGDPHLLLHEPVRPPGPGAGRGGALPALVVANRSRPLVLVAGLLLVALGRGRGGAAGGGQRAADLLPGPVHVGLAVAGLAGLVIHGLREPLGRPRAADQARRRSRRRPGDRLVLPAAALCWQHPHPDPTQHRRSTRRRRSTCTTRRWAARTARSSRRRCRTSTGAGAVVDLHGPPELRPLGLPPGPPRAVGELGPPPGQLQQPVVPQVDRVHAGDRRHQVVEVVRRLPRPGAPPVRA